MLKHKSTDKSFQLPIGKAGPDSSCQCTTGLMLGGLDPLCIHHKAATNRSRKSYMSDLKLEGLKKHKHGESGCMQVRVIFTRVCPAQGCLAGLPFLSSPALAGIKCIAEESGLASGKL